MSDSSFHFQLKQGDSTEAFKIAKGSALVFGRSQADADVVVANPLVSRMHARIEHRATGVFVVDMGSSNGTYFGDVRLPTHGELCWTDGIVSLGGPSGVLLIPIEQRVKTSPGNTQNRPNLSALLQEKSEIIVGRSPDCDYIIHDVMVSRKHARVSWKSGKFWVEDLNSTNGTYVNGKPIKGRKEVQADDVILVGMQRMSLSAELKQSSKEFVVIAEGITKVFSNGVCGLQDTTIKFPAKQFVALMGPSGCGKSTLLKALNGDSPPSTGTVRIFDLDLDSHFDAIKHVIGYVPQENIVHDALTVEDALYYSAKIRLPEDTGEEEIQSRISSVLRSLKIDSPTIRKTPISKLSGGQKKRVCIATELLTKPKVLFLDEPTSPLDPETIEEFLTCIRELCATEDTTVIMVTHKPEDLEYVDRVVFMGVRGHLSFDGRKEKLLSHFGMNNIVQLYALLSDEAKARFWHKKWFQHEGRKGEQFKALDSRKSHANPFKQLFWLSRRYFHIKLANRENIGWLVLQPIVIAALICVAYPQLVKTMNSGQNELNQALPKLPQLGVLFLTAIASIWFGVSNSAKEIVGEWDIAQREFRVNVMLFPYLLSKQIVLSVISALQLLLFLCVLFCWYENLNNVGEMYWVLLLVGGVSIQFGLFLSTMSRSVESVMSLLPLALMPQIILSGILQPLEQSLQVLLSSLTIGRWSTEALARVQDDVVNEDSLFTQKVESHLYPDEVDLIVSGSLESNVWALTAMFFIFLSLVTYRLAMKVRPVS
jgi:ABC-type multidrug transport system ATPase subunit/pSer/pThr/pTyr-binding forkhead associated (FHA) protein